MEKKIKIRYNTDSKDGSKQWRVIDEEGNETLVDQIRGNGFYQTTIDDTPNGKKGHITVFATSCFIGTEEETGRTVALLS